MTQIPAPPHAVPQVALAPDYAIPRLIKGNWQLAGGHGRVFKDHAIADMIAFADAGITAFDCADIYTGVEEMIGSFVRHWRKVRGSDAPPIRVHTKCVPDLEILPRITRQHIEAIIDRSLARLGTERLDLVQFHWWDCDIPGCVDAALHLQNLQRAGKIHHLGLTNFDAAHVVALLDAGVPIVAHQVQVSLLDARALRTLSAIARERHVPLLAYGALAGGFLSARWLGAAPPTEPLENRSLTKYRLIIDEYGGWEAFQDLLRTLARIAALHGTSISTVALRYVLDQPAVAAAIVGARHALHLDSTLAAIPLPLSGTERAVLEALVTHAPGPAGEVYALERIKGGTHAAIMRYDLNQPS